MPATDTWTGAVSGSWADPGNWQSDTVPVANDSLVFPSGAMNLTNSNDLTAGTDFAALTISGSGYAIGGNAIALTGPIDASQASGSDTVSLPIGFTGPAAVTVNQNGASLVLGGALSGPNGLTLQGAGELDLTATNTYPGTTTVSGGILRVDGTQGQSPVVINAGATLGGSGTVGSITANAGTVSPGVAVPAALTNSGNLNMGSGSTYAVTLNGDTAVSQYTQMSVAGTVTLGGASLSTTLGFSPTGHDQFTIINNTGGTPVVGTFAGLSQGSTVTINGQPFQISYTGGDGNDVTLTHLVASGTTLAATPTSSVFGQTVSLQATVASGTSGVTTTPTGTVTFFNGTTSLGTATLSGGVATLSTAALPTGSDSITAQYAGDGTYSASTSTAQTVTVAQDSTATALTANPTSASSGQSVTLTANVTALGPGSGTPTGTVEFLEGSTKLGTATLSSGAGSLTTTTLPAGSNSITAEYLGDTNFLTSTSSPATVTITQASATTLASSASTTFFGQSVTLAATVAGGSGTTGTPTGTVEFLNGSTDLGTATLSGAGVATLATGALPVGSDSVTAQYQGDSNFAASTSAAVTQTVLQASSNTTVTGSPNPAGLGQSVTFTATVAATPPGAGTPTGNIEFLSGSTDLGSATLSNGVATFSTSSLTQGANTITAQYQGDTNFLSSVSPSLTETVTAGTATVTLTASTTNPVTTQLEQLTATVAAVSPATATPTGTVDFFANGVDIGTATLSSGTATLSTTSLAVGGQSITAVYSGDSNYGSATSNAVGVLVGDAIERYLNQVYLDVLHRSPSEAELVPKRDLLEEGYARRYVVGTIVHSREAQLTAVNSAYQMYLGRDATTGEVSSAFRAPTAVSGANFNAKILGSSEYYQDEGGGTNQGFLDALSRDVLGASLYAPTESQLLGALDRGASRTSIARELIQSYQGRSHLVSTLFQEILGRSPHDNELGYYMGLLKRGGTTEDVIIDILSSDEFYNQFTTI